MAVLKLGIKEALKLYRIYRLRFLRSCMEYFSLCYVIYTFPQNYIFYKRTLMKRKKFRVLHCQLQSVLHETGTA